MLQRWLGKIGVLGLALATLPMGCSLSLRPRTLSLKLTGGPKTRGRGPEIGAFQYYGLSFGGPLSDSLGSALDTGRRSLGCLKLEGLVLFPLTYEELTQTGVSVTLPSASVIQVTVLGFHDTPVTNAGSIRALFADVTDPGVYILASTSIDTEQSSHSISASYTVTTENLVTGCPASPLPLSFHSAYRGFRGRAII